MKHLQLPLLALAALTQAHGDHAPHNQDPNQIPLHQDLPPSSDWATNHMISEHHIGNLDPRTFFTLHDYDADTLWETGEILRTYGLSPASTDGFGNPGARLLDGGRVPEYLQDMLVSDLMKRFDTNGDMVVSLSEFEEGWARGERLKDWGWGPGHHGDDELEYEIHHFERFHDENTTEEDLVHPEDEAHFRAHEEMEAREERMREMEALGVVEKNIPGKFRRY